MRLQSIRSRIQRGRRPTYRGSKRGSGLDDLRFNKVLSDFGGALTGFYGKGHFLIAWSRVILDLALRVRFVRGLPTLQRTYSGESADTDQNDYHKCGNNRDVQTTTLLFSATTHVSTRFRRLRRHCRVEGCVIRRIHPLRVIGEKIIEIIGHRSFSSYLFLLSIAVCSITTADC